MRAFITGITGFVASHLVEHLLDMDDAVMGSALHGEWNAVEASSGMRQLELVAWDLRTEPSAATMNSLRDFAPNCIYHLAALSNPQQCGEQQPTELARQVNVEGTRRVLALAQQLPTKPRVIVVSSSYVYGKVSAERPRVSEKARLAPHRGYGKTKAAAEQLALAAVATGEVDCVIARPFNHTGPRQPPEMMLPEWTQQVADPTIDPVVVHTLNAWLDLADVRDVVRAYRLLAARGAMGEAYNIGRGAMLRSGDCFARLHQLAGGDRSVEESRPGQRVSPIADCAKLQAATGWHPQIPLWRTIADTLEYWQKQVQR